jgi:hypothetical protein
MLIVRYPLNRYVGGNGTGILALVLWPVVWVLLLPFRLVGIVVDAVFAFLRAVLFLPARLLGYRSTADRRASV